MFFLTQDWMSESFKNGGLTFQNYFNYHVMMVNKIDETGIYFTINQYNTCRTHAMLSMYNNNMLNKKSLPKPAYILISYHIKGPFLDTEGRILDFIRRIERRIGWKARTRIHSINQPDIIDKKYNYKVVEPHRRWFLAPPLMSLFLWCLREGYRHIKGQTTDVSIASMDANYRKEVVTMINCLRAIGTKKIFKTSRKKNWDLSVGASDGYTNLNASGLQAFVKQAISAPQKDRWYNEEVIAKLKGN